MFSKKTLPFKQKSISKFYIIIKVREKLRLLGIVIGIDNSWNIANSKLWNMNLRIILEHFYDGAC